VNLELERTIGTIIPLNSTFELTALVRVLHEYGRLGLSTGLSEVVSWRGDVYAVSQTYGNELQRNIAMQCVSTVLSIS